MLTLFPPWSVTATRTEPVVAGETAVSVVALTTVTLALATEPKVAVVPAMNPVPVTVTVVPPTSGPSLGASPVMVGTGS